MPRIVHLISTPSGFGGAEAVMLALIQGGAERGWEQTVLNPFASSSEEELAKRCAGFAYEAFPLPRARPLGMPATLGWAKRRLQELRPDLLQVYLPHALVLSAALRRPAGTVAVLSHQHGMHFQATGRRLAGQL